jgi:23S rRNA (cytosine1962-C5)-methyltransferase
VNRVVLRGGPPVHPWIFSKRVQSVDRGARDGDVVALATREGRPCGYGFWHSRSLVAVRVLSLDPDRPPDEAWLRERVREAVRLRRDVLRLGDVTNAWRVVHGESDGLSGLVVDRYDDLASVALYSLGWARRLDEVESVLREEAAAARLVVRADERTAVAEGVSLPPPPRVGTVEVVERGVRYLVDPAAGHKTGFFLDQRDHRALVATLARGRRVFDGMTYTGGFALAAAKGGAASVTAVDLDEDAIETARGNASRNGADVVRFVHADTFDALRALAAGPVEERPDLLIVDPPKWARDRAGLRTALAKHADLHRLALSAVADGGMVLACSCSGLVSQDDFLGTLRAAALDHRTELRFLHVGGAAPDHPVAASFPEGRYLVVALAALGPRGEGPGRSERPGFERDDADVPGDAAPDGPSRDEAATARGGGAPAFRRPERRPRR